MAALLEKRYTYQEYKELDVEDNFLYELLNGELVKKSAPTPLHQRVVRELLLILHTHVKANKLGEVFCAPIDVFLDQHNVPQPDLVFVSVARQALITNDGIMGPPDLVVEIISPGSLKRDRVDKLKLYKKYQITEFWLIDPNNRSVEVYAFHENDYDIFSFAVTNGAVQSQVLAGLSVETGPLFD